jgi:hypothetical protein
MTGFESPFPAAVSQVGVRVWELLLPGMRYHDGDVIIDVPAGQRTDWASRPVLLRWAFDQMTGTAPTLLHDRLWRHLVPAGEMTYRDADRILREALLSLRDPETGKPIVDRFTAWVMWASVRLGALLRPGGWRGWWRDAPRVLAIMIPVGLFLTIPTVVGAPFLAVIWVLKRITR